MRLEPWPEERVRAVYRTERYTGGAFDPDGFHLDPLALCRGYARAALARGAFLFEASPALRLEGGEGRFRLRTPCGVVEAETVVLATSAYGDAILPELRRAILPVASYVVVTEPLGRRLEEVVGAPWAVYDDRFAVGYYRPLPEGRLLWGGRVSLRDDPPDLARLMRRDLARVYPQLAKVRIEHAWPGRMGFARHKMPVVRPLGPGVWATTAYGGHGLNTTTMGGELVAAAIAEGDDRWRLLAPFAPVPVFGRLGRLAAQGIYWGRAAGDVLRAARLRRRTR
jgi:gamma-glutamylputrescine oxidase